MTSLPKISDLQICYN